MAPRSRPAGGLMRSRAGGSVASGDRFSPSAAILRPPRDDDAQGAVAGAIVWDKAPAVAFSAGVAAEFGKKFSRLHRDQARPPIGGGVARGFQPRAGGAAAADPARHNGTVGADDRF